MKKQKSSFEMRGLGGVRKTKGDIVFDTCVYVLVTLICLICLYPMLFVLFASFSNGNKLHFHTGPLFAPLFPMTLDGYKTVLANKDIVTGYMNTIIYLLGGTAFSMVLTIMGAYVLSRRGYKLKKFFTIYLALTMYISGGMIPSFLVVRWLHMLDTRWAIIIVGSVSTWNMIVLRTAFAAIPKGLEEAATIDGAGYFRILTNVIVPAIKPAMIVVAMFLFIQIWNDLLQQMVYINTEAKFTISMGLSQLKGSLKTDWSAIMCGTCMSFVPGVVFYLLGQRYFVEGIVMTGMKN